MNTAAKSSLAVNLSVLADAGVDFAGNPAEARATLDRLRAEHTEFQKFLTNKFTRLPKAQQRVLLALFEHAQDQASVPLLERWGHNTALPVQIRVQVLAVQERLEAPIDRVYQEALQQAEQVLHHLQTADPVLCTEAGTLQSPWDETLCTLPLDLALDIARDIAASHPEAALTVLRTLRQHVPTDENLPIVTSLANLPLEDSALVLQEMLAEAPGNKARQKAIKTALHRLKAQGVAVPDTPRARVVVGTAMHRLERCLASFIDGAGDRMLLMIRTKAGGGYNIAYLIINYGSGIRYATGLQANKRELPEMLAKAGERAPLIDLEPAYCQYQVALAHQMNLDTNTPVPEEYFLLRDVIGEADTTYDEALIYSALSAEDLEAAKALEAHAGGLLNLPEFAGWTLPESIIQKYGDALGAIESSQIVVSPALQRERTDEIRMQAMEEALGEASRRIMRLRLEEMAYYYWQTDRHQEALWAVATAQSLRAEDAHLLRRNPFAGALLERSLESAKQRPSSRIVLPFSAPPQPSRQESSEPRLII